MSREMHDGHQDKLFPLKPLDLSKINCFSDLLSSMAHTAFGARSLGDAFSILREMAKDPDCLIVVTISGAMTVAKMGSVLCSMIERGLAHIIITTGAIMA